MKEKEATAFGVAGRRVLVSGHRGMVGRRLRHRLERAHCTVLIPLDEGLKDAYRWFVEHAPAES